ncbi:MAG: ketopantoate reductase family protein [Burkholderiaceae bacterium]|nr:ketopantoate reductase family protein [Burkholderiaceae bacterium]
MKKLLFLGAGGVGGYFGARLIEAGVDVSFLVRPARAALLVDQGLTIRSPHGDLNLAVRCVTRETVRPEYDLVLLAPKACDLDDALDSIAPAVGPGTFVMPFLNGLAHMDAIDARFGAQRVLGGVAHVAAVLDADGSVRQLNPVHALIAGGRDAATQRAAAEFVALCAPASFDATVSADIVATLWEKWTFLATLAGITTLMQGSIGEVMDTTLGESLVRRMYTECLSAAERSGRPVPDAAQGKALRMLTQRGSSFTASMLRDLQAGLRTEHDHVLGDLVKRAQGHGVDTPLLAAAHAHLQVLASRRREPPSGK